MRLISLLLLLVSIGTLGQNRFDLLPENMSKYVGKVQRDSFEKIVGEPIACDGDSIYYEVINSYDDVLTGMCCIFRPSDGVLVSARLITGHFMGYFRGFTLLEGFHRGEEAKRRGNLIVRKDARGNILWVKLKLRHFGCNIRDIRRHGNFHIATIVYYVQ